MCFSLEALQFIENKIDKKEINKSPYHPAYTIDLESTVHQANIIITHKKLLTENGRDVNEEFRRLYPQGPNKIQFFTDGSKLDGKTGYGACAPEINWEFSERIPNKASVYTAEASAIYNVLNHFKTHLLNSDYNECEIFTDNQGVALAITGGKKKNHSYLIYKIKEKIYDLDKSSIKVTIIWIPSHIGIEYNEKADELAKNATKLIINTEIKVPYSDFYELTNDSLTKTQTKYIHEQDQKKGEFFIQNFFLDGKFAKKPWFWFLPDDRRIISPLLRLRSNHTSLNESLFRKKMINSLSCECGWPSEDVYHFFFECHHYEDQRKKLKVQMRKDEIYFNTSKDLLNLLKSKNKKILLYIADYINKTKGFI